MQPFVRRHADATTSVKSWCQADSKAAIGRALGTGGMTMIRSGSNYVSGPVSKRSGGRRPSALLSATVGAVLLASANVSVAQTSATTTWSITPYIWAPTTKVDLALMDESIGQDEISFNDLLDTLDAAFMVHVEGGQGNWSAFGDLTFLDTSDTTERPLLTVDTDSEQIFLDAAVAYWPGGTGSNLSVFGGLRYSSFDDRYRFSLNGEPVGESRTSNDYYDALLGARYFFALGDRWALLTRGDLSFGDSEGTFLLRAELAYAVGKRRQNQILIGYQYKQAEFKDGDLTTDFTYYGPNAGFSFRF